VCAVLIACSICFGPVEEDGHSQKQVMFWDEAIFYKEIKYSLKVQLPCTGI
jgi:hypothetical protein